MLTCNADIFQYFDNKLSVLKLCGRTFISLSSPPFINCHNLKFLWLHHCQVQDTDTDTAGGEEEEAMIRRCFQNLWVLDVRYTRRHGILSARLLDFMTQLRELNVSEIFVFWSLLKTFFTKRPKTKRLLKIDHF